MGTSTFWSYTHKDDAAEEGRIGRLAAAIAAEYSLLSGSTLDLFIDTGIGWGENWRDRINTSLGEATFLIPVVTPRFLTSVECRKEVLNFASEAKALGRVELLMPILWTNVTGLDEDSEDDVVRLIVSSQWEDWSELRLESESSSDHRKAVNRLASRLLEVGSALVAEDPLEVAGVRPPAVRQTDTDDQDGFLEKYTLALDAMPRIETLLDDFQGSMAELVANLNDAQPDIEAASAKRNPAAMLTVTRQLAKRLEPTARHLDEIGTTYLADLQHVDGLVLEMIDLATAHPALYWESFEASATPLVDLAQAARGASGSFADLLDVMKAAGSLSKDLKQVLGELSRGVRKVNDGQAVFDEWERRIQLALANNHRGTLPPSSPNG